MILHDKKRQAVLFPRVHPWQLLKEGFVAFIDDNALTRGAAIAFYAVTAIAPVLFIATAIAGLFLGPKAASAAVGYQLRQLMSPESADLVQAAIVHVRGTHHSLLGSLLARPAASFILGSNDVGMCNVPLPMPTSMSGFVRP